jgi:hypothetical protein
MKRRIILVILLAGILFPFAALRRFSSTYATVFDRVFHLQLIHILMHSALFASLSWVVLSFISKKPMKQIALICMSSVFGVALLQEALQMVSTHTHRYTDSLFDLGVDLVAGSIPVIVKLFLLKHCPITKKPI